MCRNVHACTHKNTQKPGKTQSTRLKGHYLSGQVSGGGSVKKGSFNFFVVYGSEVLTNFYFIHKYKVKQNMGLEVRVTCDQICVHYLCAVEPQSSYFTALSW